MHYFFSIKLNDDQICESIVTKSYKFIWDENINDPLTVNLNKGSIKNNEFIKKKKKNKNSTPGNPQQNDRTVRTN